MYYFPANWIVEEYHINGNIYQGYLYDLEELDRCSLRIISKLTEKAAEYTFYHKSIISAIYRRLSMVQSSSKLLLIYLIDSILKESEVFRIGFSDIIISILPDTYLQVDQENKLKIEEVLESWKTHWIFPHETLEFITRDIFSNELVNIDWPDFNSFNFIPPFTGQDGSPVQSASSIINYDVTSCKIKAKLNLGSEFYKSHEIAQTSSSQSSIRAENKASPPKKARSRSVQSFGSISNINTRSLYESKSRLPTKFDNKRKLIDSDEKSSKIRKPSSGYCRSSISAKGRKQSLLDLNLNLPSKKKLTTEDEEIRLDINSPDDSNS